MRILFSIFCFLLGSYKDLLEDRLELIEIPRKKLTLPICQSQCLKLLLKCPRPWPQQLRSIAATEWLWVWLSFAIQDVQYASSSFTSPKNITGSGVWINSRELVIDWYLQHEWFSSVRSTEINAAKSSEISKDCGIQSQRLTFALMQWKMSYTSDAIILCSVSSFWTRFR